VYIYHCGVPPVLQYVAMGVQKGAIGHIRVLRRSGNPTRQITQMTH
jgi:hypothetical protein